MKRFLIASLALAFLFVVAPFNSIVLASDTLAVEDPKTENPEEKPKPDEPKPEEQKPNPDGSNTDQPNPEDGGKLPETATSYPSGMLAGLALLAVGSLALFRLRRA